MTPRSVKRIPGLCWIIALVALAGCGRHPDPLEWKIEAGTPGEMQQWLGANLPLMPPKLAHELRACIANIQITLPPAKTSLPMEQANKLCARLNGRTVRAVVIEGNELSNNMLVARAKNLSDQLVHLLNIPEGMTEEQQDEQMARAANTRLDLQEVKQQITRSENRLAELHAGAGR